MTIRACPHCETVQFSTDDSLIQSICPTCGLDLHEWYSMAVSNSKASGECLTMEEIESQVLDGIMNERGIAVKKETKYERYFGSPELLVDRLMTCFHRCPLNLILQQIQGFADCGSCKHFLGCYQATDEQRRKYAIEFLKEQCE